jgi:hypothetical protein
LAALLLSVSVAAARNAPAPRIDGEGVNMDAAPPPTAEPHHPADPARTEHSESAGVPFCSSLVASVVSVELANE